MKTQAGTLAALVCSVLQNLHLSRAINSLGEKIGGPEPSQPGSQSCAINCPQEVEDYVRAGIAPATRLAYRADLAHFEAWGVNTEQGRSKQELSSARTCFRFSPLLVNRSRTFATAPCC